MRPSTERKLMRLGQETANEIRSARKKAGLTQAKMSEVMGIPLRTIEDWESGKSEPRDYVRRLVIDYLKNYKGGKTE